MKFFIPVAKDDAEAESVYSSIAEFMHVPVPEEHDQRIWKLSWKHNGMDMECEVGKPLPSYYRTGEEPVLAILDAGNVYKVCTPNRGAVRGEAVLAGMDFDSHPIFFE